MSLTSGPKLPTNQIAVVVFQNAVGRCHLVGNIGNQLAFRLVQLGMLPSFPAENQQVARGYQTKPRGYQQGSHWKPTTHEDQPGFSNTAICWVHELIPLQANARRPFGWQPGFSNTPTMCYIYTYIYIYRYVHTYSYIYIYVGVRTGAVGLFSRPVLPCQAEESSPPVAVGPCLVFHGGQQGTPGGQQLGRPRTRISFLVFHGFFRGI